MRATTREPAWAWVLAGILAWLAWRERGEPPAGPVVTAAEAARWTPRDAPAGMAVRDLRRMPGVGDRRAAAAARARWEHDPANGPLEWIDVPGIGEITAAHVGAWLAERGVAHARLRAPPAEAGDSASVEERAPGASASVAAPPPRP